MPTPIVISNTLIQAVNAVWNYIGNDLMQCAEECGEPVTNEEAVESCLDADRMFSQGHKEAQAEFEALVKEHGYGAVAKAVRKVCNLA